MVFETYSEEEEEKFTSEVYQLLEIDDRYLANIILEKVRHLSTVNYRYVTPCKKNLQEGVFYKDK